MQLLAYKNFQKFKRTKKLGIELKMVKMLNEYGQEIVKFYNTVYKINPQC